MSVLDFNLEVVYLNRHLFCVKSGIVIIKVTWAYIDITFTLNYLKISLESLKRLKPTI